MQISQQTTEQLITGMTKSELAAVICAVVIIFALLVAVVHYVIKLNLKPLASLPQKVDKLSDKFDAQQQQIKSTDDINNMITVRVQEHELNCRVPIPKTTRRRAKAVPA